MGAAAFFTQLESVGVFVFAVGYLIISYRQHLKNSGDVLLPSMELFHWCRPLEYAFYFMLYVYLTPRLGYLPTTLLIYTALTLRAGYRNLRYIILALAVGFTTVFTFKTLLQVRIPGGQMYELFPEHIPEFHDPLFLTFLLWNSFSPVWKHCSVLMFCLHY